jgi:hypothetical protein
MQIFQKKNLKSFPLSNATHKACQSSLSGSGKQCPCGLCGKYHWEENVSGVLEASEESLSILSNTEHMEDEKPIVL